MTDLESQKAIFTRAGVRFEVMADKFLNNPDDLNVVPVEGGRFAVGTVEEGHTLTVEDKIGLYAPWFKFFYNSDGSLRGWGAGRG